MPNAPDIILHLQDERWKSPLRPYTKTVLAACRAALKAEGIKKADIAVVLTNDKTIKDLNHSYRGKNKPTNVLSFASDEGEGLSGDIVLAFETVKREATEQGKTIRSHTTHLLVHGVLHLLGHDHEKDKDAQDMEKREIKILEKLGISNPYL